MNLSGQQRKKLQEALINAFPKKSSIEQLLSFELDKNLDEIIEDSNLNDIVFNLIRIAEAQGWVKKLILAACKLTPENLLLKSVAEELLTHDTQQKTDDTKQKTDDTENWNIINEEKLPKDPLDTSMINSIDISADGQILVSGDDKGVIRVWNLNSKKEINAFRGHEDSVKSVAIHSERNMIISGGKSGNGKIWQMSTDSTFLTPPKLLHNSKWHSTAIRSIAISKDSTSPIIVSVSEGGTVEVKSININATDAKILIDNRYNFRAFERYRKSVRSLSLSANGRVLVLSTGTKRVKVWTLDTIRESPYDFPEMHNKPVSAVAIAPDGQIVVSGDESGQMKIWNLKTNSKKSCHSTSAINSLAIVNGGHFFVSGNQDGQIEVWDSIKGIMIVHLGGHARSVQSVAVSADVRVVASSSQNGEIKVWRLQI
ncbi:hypothetical protein F7734_02825 [Scytonema sp. UIC 10036]|uniref:effector-associated domain EAD1-containing protein n=1 Tax=Scytonema sp. UIC 10036 TaxID=2304196 RepID=UPI0012DA3CF3|nr:effector-associated domain EAD1-containing protein [Scytonema sp. UIC 10036]MUG91477.1 hypothetical protein [Scytonema sp. UIC 10036]